MSDLLLLSTVRQLLASATALVDQLVIASARGEALPAGPPTGAPPAPGAPRRRGRPPKNPAAGSAPPATSASTPAQPAPNRRRTNVNAGKAAAARWAAMTPEQREERIRKMQAARKRGKGA